MKLSEIKGDRVMDVVADLIGPVAILADDPEVVKLFRMEKVPEGTDARKYLMDRLKRGLPPLLKTHKVELVQILATLEGVEPDEYAEKMTLSSLFHDLLELLTDKAFEEFF